MRRARGPVVSPKFAGDRNAAVAFAVGGLGAAHVRMYRAVAWTPEKTSAQHPRRPPRRPAPAASAVVVVAAHRTSWPPGPVPDHNHTESQTTAAVKSPGQAQAKKAVLTRDETRRTPAGPPRPAKRKRRVRPRQRARHGTARGTPSHNPQASNREREPRGHARFKTPRGRGSQSHR